MKQIIINSIKIEKKKKKTLSLIYFKCILFNNYNKKKKFF